MAQFIFSTTKDGKFHAINFDHVVTATFHPDKVASGVTLVMSNGTEVHADGDVALKWARLVLGESREVPDEGYVNE